MAEGEFKTILVCPGCTAEFPEHLGAVSRYDNRTDICSDCGSMEGIAQFYAMQAGHDARTVLKAPGKLAEGTATWTSK
jgi:hypothetical protein